MTQIEPVAEDVRIATLLTKANTDEQILHLTTDDHPTSEAMARRIQDLLFHPVGDVPAFKLGATIAAVRDNLQLIGPFFAPLPSYRVYPAGAVIHHRSRGVECEYGFRLARDISADDTLADDETMQTWFDHVHATIEIPGTRFASLGAHGGLALMMDYGAAGALIIGPGCPLSGELDLADAPVRLSIEGRETAVGRGNVMDGGAPQGPLPRFIRDAISRGHLLRRGQIIVTGSCTGYVTVEPGQVFTARFDALSCEVSGSFVEGTLE